MASIRAFSAMRPGVFTTVIGSYVPHRRSF
jgi:hypothetical protein